MAASRQLRLLLWKDYLVRKRNVITLAGLVWATTVALCLVVVRLNIDDKDFSTCQYGARALPSAGVLTFLQSFICNVNNECSPLDQFQQIPTYEKSKLTQLKRQVGPLLSNETVLDVASTVPDALRLLSTLADVADNPTFLEITKNGLHVKDLFNNPPRVKRYISSKLDVSNEVANSLMESEISFSGLMEGGFDRCNKNTMMKILKANDDDNLAIFLNELCSMSKQDVQKLAMDLLLEVNMGKYVKMLGAMYYKLSGDERITQLGDMVTAGLRMMSFHSFLPRELSAIIRGQEPDFNYVNLTMITTVMDLFQPIFGDTESYKSMRGVMDTAIVGVQYLYKFMSKQFPKPDDNTTSLAVAGTETNAKHQLEGIMRVFDDVADMFEEVSSNDTISDVFNVLSKVSGFIVKFLPDQTKHDVLLYSTILSKLIEGAQQVININTNIEQFTYNVSQRHPKAIKILLNLPSEIVEKGLDAFTDAERTQILTSKLDSPAEVFCDEDRIQKFFLVQKDEAVKLKGKLCTDDFKHYIADMLKSFGIYEVRNNINSMASIFVLETLGRDVSAQMYPIEKDFEILKNFTKTLTKLDKQVTPTFDWTQLLGIPEDSEFMKIVTEKRKLGKQMLIIVHGALAKEVVKQNPLLEYKITPFLIDTMAIVEAFILQLHTAPEHLVLKAKELYPEILQTLLMTALDEEKAYKTLSTPCEEILCHGAVNASEYLTFPANANENLVPTLCNISIELGKAMEADSIIGKAIRAVSNSKHNAIEVNWTKLITDFKDLYTKLYTDYTYIFEFKSYGMTEDLQTRVADMMKEAKQFWFSLRNLSRSLHLSIKLGLRVLDLIDRNIFDVKSDMWLKIKFVFTSATGPLFIIDDVIRTVGAVIRNESIATNLPPSTARALRDIVPNLPHLIVDFVGVVLKGDIDLEPIISLMNTEPVWPCSPTGVSELLALERASRTAVVALETVACLDRDFQQEWVDYMNRHDVTFFKIKNWNTTYPPHVFLKFSKVFDNLINDTADIKDIMLYALDESPEDGHLSLISAMKNVFEAFNTTDRDRVLRSFFSKFDIVLNAVNTSSIEEDLPLHALWQRYLSCDDATTTLAVTPTVTPAVSDECRTVGRATWKHTLNFLSVALENVAGDLLTYFTEANERNTTLLQLVGFTKNTGLYMLYDRMPDFIGVLLNSYWDFGFMTQIRRASLSQFWDCEAVVAALRPAPGSPVDQHVLRKVQPFICPSLLYWISLPRGDNIILDVIAKPQYLFFNLHISNLTSTYQNAFVKASELGYLLNSLAKKNKTDITEQFKMSALKTKLENGIDKILTYKIDESDPDYKNFADINKRQFVSSVYLTRVVTMVNKLNLAFENLKLGELLIDVPEIDSKKLEAELSMVQKIFKRRPTDAIAIHFDVITDMLWTNSDSYRLTEALESMCDQLQRKDASKVILSDTDRVKIQICSKNYKILFGAIQNVIAEDLPDARQSLLNFVRSLQGDADSDIFKLFQEREQEVEALKISVKYSYDLGLSIYLKYLQSNLQQYNIVTSFLLGEDWWGDLRRLYSGPNANQFFDAAEQCFDVADDILSNLDKIHVVRLLRDVNVNSTESFCRPNVTLADYVPDARGLLAALKRRVCDADKTPLYSEIPPLLFASQGYDSSLKLSKEIDYPAVYSDLSKTEYKLAQLNNGVKSPLRPDWITDEKVAHLRTAVLGLLSKETLTKVAFGGLSNIVDAGTLFLNNSQCTLCSQLTTWFKQISLQLYKKQEYDSLLCRLQDMTLEDVYLALNNDFHWGMAISELISTRNYTKYELNKSTNELLEQVKMYLLEDITANTTKIADCLAMNVSRNAFGNATLLTRVMAHTSKLFRAELPHLHTINGITDLPYFKQLSKDVAHNLDVHVMLNEYLNENNELHKMLEKPVDNKKLRWDIENARLNLRYANELKPKQYILQLSDQTWEEVCEVYNCSRVMELIQKNINKTMVTQNLPKLQAEEFWSFNFISRLLKHEEDMVGHIGRLLGVVSQVDVYGAAEGRLRALIDLAMQLLMDDSLEAILYSLRGMLAELQPVLRGTPLEVDVKSLANGLLVLHSFKNYIVNNDVQVRVSDLFSRPDRVEVSLGALGINDTNFWSIAAPRLLAGRLMLAPIFEPKQGIYHISDFVCQMENMSRVILPEHVDVVTVDDVYGAVIEQWCDVSDEQAKMAVGVLVENLNFTYIVEKVKSFLLSELYAASNVSAAAGARALQSSGRLAALLPEVRTAAGAAAAGLAREPLLQRLRRGGPIGGVLGSDFMADAGRMVCGKPFQVDTNRFVKAIAANVDLTGTVDEAQLQALPTDFCRSLYRDVVSMEGGKIVWSFVKPLIMGKILYTPTTSNVRRIIERANMTFAPMAKMVGLVHSFANAFPSVDKLSGHRSGVMALRNIVSEPRYEDIRKMLFGDVAAPDIDIDGLFDEIGDTKSLGSLLKRASEFLQCVNLDRFQAATDEHELALEAARLSSLNEFSAGLVFLNSSLGEQTNVEYKLRMDIENSPTTKRLKNYLWIPGPEDDFIQNMRYFRGFIEIQDIVDKAIIELSRNKSRRIAKREAVDLSGDEDWAVYTQQEPYPCYRKDLFQTSLYESQATIVAFFFAFLFSVCSIVRFLVADKESGNTMIMSVMGVRVREQTLSWLVMSGGELLVTVLAVSLVLKLGGVLPRTDFTLILCLLVVFGFSVLMFCYMMTKLFTSASFAAVCVGITYLITFMPYVLILSLEAALTSSLKLFVSLAMSSAVCYAFLYVTRFEAMGVGARWAQLWDSPDGSEDMNIGYAGLMVLFDGLLYMVIGLIIERFWGYRTIKSSVTTCVTSEDKAGVSIINVSKTYGTGRRAKLALDDVCVEMASGQVTTLLGHNGAGKTTLIKILMGMLKPSKGEVVVRGASGLGLGVCPQRDVLVAALTAREHVALYAQLKSGRPLAEVRQEVDEIMEAVSLGAVGSEPVARLSGGTRRRLCVALAFVARPALVSLDEPTAGVDPAARRDIWSMIMKLRANRTILLTTHHLDEAELLSDQIVIMHKGRVHTTGSPIEIKRSLGSGYKLTVMYPDRSPQVERHPDHEDISIEEKTKQLLTVTRDVVKNANLVDVHGSEVEVNLPLFDAEGVSNNFLQLCSSLESRQTELGFRGYSMDCSSLEQVFFNICNQADSTDNSFEQETSSKSGSTSSVKTDLAPLLPAAGPLRGSPCQQFLALLHYRYLHYIRNKWLLFLLIMLPSIFVTVAMAFSKIRPPADAEVSLRLYADMYMPSTQYIVPKPTILDETINPYFAQRVLDTLQFEKKHRNWTSEDSPVCQCVDTIQHCDIDSEQPADRPAVMALPDVAALNHWIVDSHPLYIDKRYVGYTAHISNNATQLVAWYNNKGHHALPAALNALNTALLRALSGDNRANITIYTHPLKISKEQINKENVYQHVADAGISCMLLVAYALVAAGGALPLVAARRSQEKRLQLLSGVRPALYWAAAAAADMAIIVVNMVITAVVLEIFHYAVFVARNNLPAICILILLYGYGCTNFVHVAEKLFNEASLANMVLFCGNAFLGLSGTALLLILDVISDSEMTDNARWWLHKIFLLSPQFALGDGLLEIAKNTIQAEVLAQFGMDTYRDPLTQDVVRLHYIMLVVVGTFFLLLNLAIEYDCFDIVLDRFRRPYTRELSAAAGGGAREESADVAGERERVRAERARQPPPLRLRTIGNINAGFVDIEEKKKGSFSLSRSSSLTCDAASCVDLSKVYRSATGHKVAVDSLTLGIPTGKCTALLGENGAGKSTTFAMLTGELRPSGGRIYLLDTPVHARDLCKGQISYCPQTDAVDPLLTVHETLKFYCRLRGITDEEHVISRTLGMFELRAYAAVRAGDLSGGNRRKLCTAIAFMARSTLILLDEPTSGMDPGSRACVWRGARAAGGAGRGLLLATHALDDARRLAARVALVRAGRLVALAPLDECLRRFGGGWEVWCRVRAGGAGGAGGAAAAAWRAVRARRPRARLQVRHRAALRFLLPADAAVEGKESPTRLSDVFRLMAELQGVCEIQDYTVNQSSLEQMFLNFSDKSQQLEQVEVEPLPPPHRLRHDSEDLDTVTSL